MIFLQKIVLIGLLILSGTSMAQIGEPSFLPAKEQRKTHFDFEKFERQWIPSIELDNNIRALQKKDREIWNALDSLYYAQELSLLKMHDEALNYYLRIELDTISNLESFKLVQSTYKAMERFDLLQASLSDELAKHPERKSVVNIKKQLNAYRSRHLLNNLNLVDSLLFPILADQSLEKMERFSDYHLKLTLPIATAFETALREEVYFQDAKDPVLSKSYEEFGDFLRSHYYESNAFVSYSISRYYDNRNGEVSNKLRESKLKLDNQNLIHPSFRKLFGKIEKGRLNYAVIKAKESVKEIENMPETIPASQVIPETKKKDNDWLPNIPKGLLSIIAVALVFVFVLLFVKTK